MSLALDSGDIPYVAYTDAANSWRLTVQKLNGSSWDVVGTKGFTTSSDSADSPSISIDPTGTPYVAYRDYRSYLGDGRVTVQKFVGSNWEVVGPERFSDGELNNLSLVIDSAGIPYVAYNDHPNSNKATVMKYSSLSRNAVGTKGFSDGEAYYPSLAISNGTLYVAYRDYGNAAKATLMKFNDTTWEVVGTKGFSDGDANYPSLAIHNGIPYVAYADWTADSGKATVMKFVGDTQTIVCSATPPEAADTDQDGVVDCNDNCPTVYNPDQANFDLPAKNPELAIQAIRRNPGDACDCNDDICTEGNDVNGNPICDPADPACADTTPPGTQINLNGEMCQKDSYIGQANINIYACDDGMVCFERSAINSSNSLLGMIKDTLIGKAYAILAFPPEGISAVYYSINSGPRMQYTGQTIVIDQPGEYILQAYAIDDAQNQGPTVTQTFSVVAECILLPTTTINLK
jgi:hypothetical protein